MEKRKKCKGNATVSDSFQERKRRVERDLGRIAPQSWELARASPRGPQQPRARWRKTLQDDEEWNWDLDKMGKCRENSIRENQEEPKAKTKNAVTSMKSEKWKRYMGGGRRSGEALGASAVFFSLWAGDLSAPLQNFLLMATKTSMEDWISMFLPLCF